MKNRYSINEWYVGFFIDRLLRAVLLHCEFQSVVHHVVLLKTMCRLFTAVTGMHL